MKKIVISGGNSGIGLEAARELTRLGNHVILLGRDAKKGESAVEELNRRLDPRAFPHGLGLSVGEKSSLPLLP